jgi:hypothetical protein
MDDGSFREDGWSDDELAFDISSRADIAAFVYAILGGWDTVSAERALSLMSEDGYYTPFLAHIKKPVFRTPPGGTWRTEIVFRLGNLRVVSAGKNANYTMTADDRLLTFDTSGGSRTYSLLAASAVNPYTIYSAVKTHASNNLVIDPNSTETIDGASTKTLTTINSRADFYSNGAAWFTVNPS